MGLTANRCNSSNDDDTKGEGQGIDKNMNTTLTNLFNLFTVTGHAYFALILLVAIGISNRRSLGLWKRLKST